MRFSAGWTYRPLALAKIVFAPPPDGPKERKYLELLTHEIGRRLAAQAEAETYIRERFPSVGSP